MSMKVISAKEFQVRHASVLKEVASGQEYQVTFHRKPMVTLSPTLKPADDRALPGSKAAFLESLKYTVPATGELRDLSYKELRQRMMVEKYDE